MKSKGIISLRKLVLNSGVNRFEDGHGQFNAYRQEKNGGYSYFDCHVYNQKLIEKVSGMALGACIRVSGDVRPFTDYAGEDGKKNYIGTVMASDVDEDEANNPASIITLIGAKLGKAYQSEDAVVFRQTQNCNRYCTFGAAISYGFGDNRQYINYNCTVFEPSLVERIVKMQLKPGSTVQIVGVVDGAPNRIKVLDLDFDSLGQRQGNGQPRQGGYQQGYAPQQPVPNQGGYQQGGYAPVQQAPVQQGYAPVQQAPQQGYAPVQQAPVQQGYAPVQQQAPQQGYVPQQAPVQQAPAGNFGQPQAVPAGSNPFAGVPSSAVGVEEFN